MDSNPFVGAYAGGGGEGTAITETDGGGAPPSPGSGGTGTAAQIFVGAGGVVPAEDPSSARPPRVAKTQQQTQQQPAPERSAAGGSSSFYPRTHVSSSSEQASGGSGNAPSRATQRRRDPSAVPDHSQRESGPSAAKGIAADADTAALCSLLAPLTIPRVQTGDVAAVVGRERERWANTVPPFPEADGDGEGGGGIDLPREATFLRVGGGGGASAVLAARPSSDHFLALPAPIQAALLRILIRLLTGENDADYDEECAFPYLSRKDVDGIGCDGDDVSESDWTADRRSLGSRRGSADTLNSRIRKGSTDSWDSMGSGSMSFPRRRSRDSVTSKGFPPDFDKEDLHDSFASFRRGLGHKDSPANTDRLQRVVRFCALGSWAGGGSYAAVDSLLDLYKSAATHVFSSDTCADFDGRERSLFIRHVLGPIARLLSLVVSAGITPYQLKDMLDLVCGGHSAFKTAPPRLLLLRCLKEAAEGGHGASAAHHVGGKVIGPQSFFVLGNGPGLVRNIKPATDGTQAWPFKTDWAMSVWFRADSFEQGGSSVKRGRPGSKRGDRKDDDCPTLLNARSSDGAGFTVNLEPYATGVATLTVASYDSALTPAGLLKAKFSLTTQNRTMEPESVRLKGCVLSPGVWYHLSVRHVKPRLKGYLTLSNVRDEVTIMLDGKVMMTEPLRFPKISSSGESVSHAASSNKSEEGEMSYTIAAGTNFSGQLSQLHVFHDYVSDATLKALYEETTSKANSRPSETLNHAYLPQTIQYSSQSPSTLTPSSNGASQSYTVRSSSTERLLMHPRDAKELVVTEGKLLDTHDESSNRGHVMSSSPSLSMTSSAQLLLNSRSFLPRRASINGFSPPLFHDLGKDEDRKGTRIELSYASLKKRLFLVWDSSRVVERGGQKLVLEAHSGLHVPCSTRSVPWTATGAKEVIASLGGAQILLPIFRAFLCRDVQPGVDDKGSSAIIIPILVSLLAAFVRGHAENAREILRCGGIDVFEQCLRENKLLQHNGAPNEYHQLATGALRSSVEVAQLLVDALHDLLSASAHHLLLHHEVCSRLFFNFPLWFGESVMLPGVALYSTLLPELASLARKDPMGAIESVNMVELIEFVREHSFLSDECVDLSEILPEEQAHLFRRSDRSGNISADIPLTIAERSHAVDVIFGIMVTLLTHITAAEQLSPLLNFITFNLHLEWEEETSTLTKEKGSAFDTNRKERKLATNKACVVLLYLLQCQPEVPGLHERMLECMNSKYAVGSWILCCLVNSHDEFVRSIGMRCLTSFLEVNSISPTDSIAIGAPDLNSSINSESKSSAAAKDAAKTISRTMKYVGSGLGVVSEPDSLVHSKANVSVIYKLLWHLLKCHRERLGDLSHAAMVNLLVKDLDVSATSSEYLNSLDGIVVPDSEFNRGYRLNMGWATIPLTHQLGIDSQQSIRDDYAFSAFLRLLRFLRNDMKERWLFDLLTLIRVSPTTAKAILPNKDWQPCLFHLISESIEEISSTRAKSGPRDQDVLGEESTKTQNRSIMEASVELPIGVISRYDLTLKLYSTLMGHIIRKGGDIAYEAIEVAASLQRVCANGHETFSILLSHVLAELIDRGTVADLESTGGCVEENGGSPLKRSARIVTMSILSNGADGLDIACAVKQWRCLRHLSAITVAVVTANGFGVADLFDYRKQHASAIDEISGGLHGIRFPSGGLLPGIAASEAVIQSSSDTHDSYGSSGQRGNERDSYRRASVILATQLLSLVDAFIFPDALDSSTSSSQLHGLALVRSTEPRLGRAQGPLLASLLRLSLLVIAHLEPSSVTFLQCCSRLRCFFLWTLELIRETVASDGQSSAFNKATGMLDRLTLAVVLQCHRTLSRCSAVLIEIESSPDDTYFANSDERQKNYGRLLRGTQELREILLAAFRGRNEVLRSGLSLEAYEALRAGLEEPEKKSRYQRRRHGESKLRLSQKKKGSTSKEEVLRSFIANTWITGFHDVELLEGGCAIPEQVANGQIYKNKAASNQGYEAIEQLAEESRAIIKDYSACLNAPFELYCEEQRKWADTDAVRDLEYNGDLAVKRLCSRHRSDLAEALRFISLREQVAKKKFEAVHRNVCEPWKGGLNWQLAKHTDRLNRRILLSPNRYFDQHEQASYELLLVKERERVKAVREEREKRNSLIGNDGVGSKVDHKGKESLDASEMAAAIQRASQGIIPMKEALANLDDDEEEIVGEAEEEPITSADTAKDIDEAGDQFLGAEEGDMDDDYVNVDDDTDSWANFFVWAEGERSVLRLPSVEIVSLQTITKGELLLTTHCLYFHTTGGEMNVMTKETNQVANAKRDNGNGDLRWRLNRLKEVHGRRYILRAQALELFFADTHELFINFKGGTRERDKFYSKLRSCKVPMLCSPKSLVPRTVFRKSNVKELWRTRRMSNFDYLMQLNIMAGRTFNDIAQYPVFPWVLADYTSDTLDLSDSKVYRDFSKPIGAHNPSRLAQILERYRCLDGFPEEQRFLYGSHYSSPGVVCHYLIRQEPFTTMHIELQSGRFDCPDRLFFDLGECWNGCMTSTSDVKELIPEFFTCPEIFLNTNNFPLGETQGKVSIGDVILPPWAKGSAHEFVRLHRLALESEYVSQNLHHWVDLIFGCKQRGEEAAKANNIFHYLSYEGSVNLDKIVDELDRKATESHIENFGQTPSQLLTQRLHPQRASSEKSWSPLCADINQLKDLRCFTPKFQFGGHNKSEARGAVLSIHPLIDHVVVVYADLSVGMYKWSGRSSGSFTFSTAKLKRLGCRDMSTSLDAFDSALPTVDITQKENFVDNNGRLGVGCWSFGVTLGGHVKDAFLRRQASAVSGVTTRVTETSLSTLSASSFIISCGYVDGQIKAHTVDGLKAKDSANGGHRGFVNCLGIGEDGGLMVSGGEDATCRVWVVDHADMASALTDGYVQTALGTSDPKKKSSTLKCCQILWGHTSSVTCLSFSSDLDVVVSGSLIGEICVHTVRRGKFIRRMLAREFFADPRFDDAVRREKDSVIRKLALDTHGSFVCHLDDGMLLKYTVNGTKLCCADSGERLNAMEICAGGEMLVTGGESCHIVIRSFSDLCVRCVLDLTSHGPIRCITLTPADLNPSPQFMFVGTDNGKVTIVGRNSKGQAESDEVDDEGEGLTYLDMNTDTLSSPQWWWK